MNELILILAALMAAAESAQTSSSESDPATIEGQITPGVQQLDNSTNSSKLNEYRDLQDNFFLSSMRFSIEDKSSAAFFDFRGRNVTRDDQTLLAAGGRPGVWRVEASWVETPHNYSNVAVTPYNELESGVLGVPATVPITFKKLGTGAADTPGVLASDDLIAAYQSTFLAPTPLSTQTNAGRFAFAWSGSDAIRLGMRYDRREKYGQKSTFGPIGDRPPRTLNIQLPEPVDYRTNEISFSAEHEGKGYQVGAEYLLSDFANRIDTFEWQNVFTTAPAGAEFDTWDRLVGTSGARPLPPDNRYHTATVNAGFDLPLDSRLTSSVSYGRLEQNQELLPYAVFSDKLANPNLPRASAEGSMDTLHFVADYIVVPHRRLNVRAFYRQYDLNNDTPSSQWQYVTSDTSNLNGTVAYVNKRVSLPYAWDRKNAGAEATWRLPGRSSLTFGYERESLGREFREADTAEDVLKATFRTRVAQWLSVQARYLYGTRDGGTYNNEVTHEGYWYAPSEATDQNNPAVTFDNHPDMRRYDVSDRERNQFDFTLNLTPRDLMAVSAYVRYRKSDFDSAVGPSQPLLGTGLPEQNATSPGDQLGLLEDERLRYGGDVFLQPSERLTLNASIGYDRGTGFERSLEFNENNKQNPSAVATAELGPWTRATSQWTADIEDRTWNAGLGMSFHIVPERATLSADYTASIADVDIAYAGFGVTNFNGQPFPPNHQFAFSSPPTIEEDLQVVNVRLEIPVKTVTIVLGYAFETYSLNDWQQDSGLPWVESVGADTLLRDTSRSYQWGNRLFNLGTYLAPGYDAHVAFVGFSYRF
jgi:MtrB/PioB family decaheme-associated outer membrane protein